MYGDEILCFCFFLLRLIIFLDMTKKKQGKKKKKWNGF